MIDNQECRTVTDEKCSTVQEKQCSTVNEQVINYILIIRFFSLVKKSSHQLSSVEIRNSLFHFRNVQLFMNPNVQQSMNKNVL